MGDTSAGYYGQIETALALYCVAMVSEAVDFDSMNFHIQKLGAALNDFITGNVLESQSRGCATKFITWFDTFTPCA
ncbi:MULTISPECIES: hypothetical protein [Helicobacter]|uniref:Uncharacterized protein n=1 Tax=Helicobacter ganmani TaxID=60246 RepID=A0A3D8I9S2_9HELI|nr:hypothetical protein [Helicobacter sp. UBA3407]RDU61504.1 hypothetical protein CQA43_09230 [Helicobacter ganmani]